LLQIENEEMEKLYQGKLDEMKGVSDGKKKKPIVKKQAKK